MSLNPTLRQYSFALRLAVLETSLVNVARAKCKSTLSLLSAIHEIAYPYVKMYLRTCPYSTRTMFPFHAHGRS